MHVSEGILGVPVLAAGAALTLGGVTIGLRKMSYDKLPEVAVLSSVFFIASLIHVPIGPSAAHLVLTGICGLLLGWAAFPAILVGLTLQALLFQFGGLTTLGVNTFNMAFPAVLMSLACGRAIQSSHPVIRGVGEFVAGAGAVVFAGILVALCLVATGEAFGTAAKLIIIAHVPVMIIEGIITVFLVEFVRKVRPEMLPGKGSL
ncbi:MAG: cobalt transporter CbiM [Desulfomonile tiedjei]|nr:cobalt transporter CbiM [Desulfomonile tiedjei]